jgi:hypothetical protein
MNDGPTNDRSVPVRSPNRGRLYSFATFILCIALLCNVAWVGLLSWLVIRTTQFLVAGL